MGPSRNGVAASCKGAASRPPPSAPALRGASLAGSGPRLGGGEPAGRRQGRQQDCRAAVSGAALPECMKSADRICFCAPSKRRPPTSSVAWTISGRVRTTPVAPMVRSSTPGTPNRTGCIRPVSEMPLHLLLRPPWVGSAPARLRTAIHESGRRLHPRSRHMRKCNINRKQMGLGFLHCMA